MYNLTTGTAARVLGRRLLPRNSLCIAGSISHHPSHRWTIVNSFGTSSSLSNSNSPSDNNSPPVQDSSTSSTTGGTKSASNPPSEEWIPPNRPLSGDQGYHGISNNNIKSDDTTTTTASTSTTASPNAAIDEALFVINDNDSEEDIQRKLEAALQLEEELEWQDFQNALQREQEQQASTSSTNQDQAPDWLATRRAALGKRAEDASRIVAIRHYELLTEQELVALLEYHDGIHVRVIRDNPKMPRMGGADGMIVCEATTLFHVQGITRALIDHLKERQLQERGVLGAQMGSNRNLHSSNWNVVDCHNYIVHILDGPTRQALQLEKLWSGKDPLWKLDVSNEDAVDRYVEQHPVPPSYGPSSQQQQQHQATWDIGKL